MKVFKYYCGQYYYGIAAQSEDLALICLGENTDRQAVKCEEIPEAEWDKEDIKMWEDNNFESKPYKVSIREQIVGAEPQLIFTNDYSTFD